jgi:hypothetical protein
VWQGPSKQDRLGFDKGFLALWTEYGNRFLLLLLNISLIVVVNIFDIGFDELTEPAKVHFRIASFACHLGDGPMDMVYFFGWQFGALRIQSINVLSIESGQFVFPPSRQQSTDDRRSK